MNKQWKINLINFIKKMIGWEEEVLTINEQREKEGYPPLTEDYVEEGQMPHERQLKHTKYSFVESHTLRPLTPHNIDVEYTITHSEILGAQIERYADIKAEKRQKAIAELLSELYRQGYIEEMQVATVDAHERHIVRLRIINPKEYHGKT